MSNQHKVLLFGPSKTGKTKGVLETYPVKMLVLNFDPQGWMSCTARKTEVMTSADYRKAMSEKRPTESWPDVTVIDYVRSAGDISTAINPVPSPAVILDMINDLNCLNRHCPFATVVLDSYTTIDMYLLDFILALNGKVTMELQHYKMLEGKKWELLTKILPLPLNVVVIAHEEASKNETTGEITLIPYGTGKVQAVIPLMFSAVLHSTTRLNQLGKVEYVVETKPRGLAKCLGTRGFEPPDVCAPDFKVIFGAT